MPPSRRRSSPPLTTPCPLCRHVHDCPFSQQPRDECLDMWPLGQPSKRTIQGLDMPAADEMLGLVSANDELTDLLCAWERGDLLSDEQYLRLRDIAITRYQDRRHEVAAFWVAMQLLAHVWGQCRRDAAKYYPIDAFPRKAINAASRQAIRGALVVCRDDIVAADEASPVRSKFERLFGDAFKCILWGLLGGPRMQMPAEDDAFREAVEVGWAEVLGYGNGLYGLSVIPMIPTLDLVRYQELGGRNRVVSRGIAEYFMLLLGAFPPLVAHVVPQLGEVAFRRRLGIMFEPMVKRYAWEALQREQALGDGSDTRRVGLEEAFREVLAHALDSYDFTFGKEVGPEGVAGMLGMSADPELREQVAAAMAHLQQPQTPRDITPVGITHYVKARMDERLREAHPARPPEHGLSVSISEPTRPADDLSLEKVLSSRKKTPDALIAGLSGDRDCDRDWLGTSAAEVPDVVACEVDGVIYRFADEMARACGVTTDQLRRWDGLGDLPAQRLADVDPSKAGTPAANWRVYPHTGETVGRVRQLAVEKAARRGKMADNEFTRAAAARVLRITAKTLGRWEKSGKAQPIWRDGKPIYTEEEIHRLVPFAPPPQPDLDD